MVEADTRGLLCAAGGFWIDPWSPVERAIVTHAHPDHTRPGCGAYLTASPGESLLRPLVGAAARVETLAYGQPVRLGEVSVSLHPAGHLPGSAQVRLERAGEIWVVSGDYRPGGPAGWDAFEPLRCGTFLTESTFALPVFRWPGEADVVAEIAAWAQSSRQSGKTAVLFAYPLGKAQRLIAALSKAGLPVAAHEAVEGANTLFRAAGVNLPETLPIRDARPGTLVLAPLETRGEPWFKRLGAVSTALASGWMRIRGARRRRSLDRGFVFADHPDWNQLLDTIQATGARRIRVMHGSALPLVRWLLEHGLDAAAIPVPYLPDPDETGAEERPAAAEPEAV
jgi:putative mRNA 3-end processing factor